MNENLTIQKELSEEGIALPADVVIEEAAEILEIPEGVEITEPIEAIEEASVKRNWRRILRIAFLVLLLIGGIAAAIIKWGVPAYQYKQAGENFSNGEYASARDIYRKLGDYKDSKDRLVEANKMIIYVQAQEYYDNEEYLMAYRRYNDLGDFLDAEARAADAVYMNRVKGIYAKAEEYYNRDLLCKAHETLLTVAEAEYRDIADRIEELSVEICDRARIYAENGELRVARWYLEYLQTAQYEPAIATWDKIKDAQKFDLDYSYYDLKAEPISCFTPKTTAEEFAAIFMHMFLNRKTYLYLPAKGVSVNSMSVIHDRLNVGYDIADECLPEYGTVYQNRGNIYWSSGNTVGWYDLNLNYRGKYTGEELGQHMDRTEAFCEESVRGLMDAGLLGNSMSNQQKAKVIYDWVSYYLTYDDTKEIRDTGVAITNKTGVCESYVGIYNRMCNLVGVRSYGQVGDTDDDDTERHIWSIQLDEEGAVFYTDVTWGDDIDINFVNREENPTVDGFYETVYKANMAELEKMEINAESIHVLDGLLTNMTDPRYFWQRRKWIGHKEERPAKEIIDCGFHNAA